MEIKNTKNSNKLLIFIIILAVLLLLCFIISGVFGLFLYKNWKDKDNDNSTTTTTSTLSKKCGVEQCHGLDVTCGNNIPEACDEMYKIGDRCLAVAKCEETDGECTMSNQKEFDNCKSCVLKCVEDYSETTSQFDCESKCGDDFSENDFNEKLKSDYEWDDLSMEDSYSDLDWKVIYTTRLEGLPGFEEKNDDDCGYSSSDYLRIEGGMCSIGYWLEKNGLVIDTQEKLIDELDSIDLPEKAVSYLAVLKSDIKIYDDIPVGHIAEINDGYLIQFVNLNTLGCTYHTDRGYLYKVSSDGVVTLLATEIVEEDEEDYMCVD